MENKMFLTFLGCECIANNDFFFFNICFLKIYYYKEIVNFIEKFETSASPPLLKFDRFPQVCAFILFICLNLHSFLILYFWFFCFCVSFDSLQKVNFEPNNLFFFRISHFAATPHYRFTIFVHLIWDSGEIIFLALASKERKKILGSSGLKCRPKSIHQHHHSPSILLGYIRELDEGYFKLHSLDPLSFSSPSISNKFTSIIYHPQTSQQSAC